MTPRRFARVGRVMCALGGGAAGLTVLGLVLGRVPAFAAFLAAPLLCVGGAMWLLPGPELDDARPIEAAWQATHRRYKIAWLAGLVLGVIVMLAGIALVLGPPPGPPPG